MHDDPEFPQEMSSDCQEFIKQALTKVGVRDRRTDLSSGWMV